MSDALWSRDDRADQFVLRDLPVKNGAAPQLRAQRHGTEIGPAESAARVIARAAAWLQREHLQKGRDRWAAPGGILVDQARHLRT